MKNIDELTNEIERLNKIIEDYIKKIQLLKDDELNNISRYPASNTEVIYNTIETIIYRYKSLILIYSSLKIGYSQFNELYIRFAQYYKNINFDTVGYIHMLWFISLGILFDIDKEQMRILMDDIDENEVDDVIYDFLFDSIGLKRKIKSKNLYWKKPYENLYNIILTAFEDKDKASEMLYEYVDKQWFKGHSNIGWKEDSIANEYGLWSYDAAVVAKIFGLEDEMLINNIHYPYILIHDGPRLDFELTKPIVIQNKVHKDNYQIKNKEFKSIIPNCLYRIFDKIVQDMKELDNKSLYVKYKLNEIWFSLDEFEEVKDTCLGGIIVNILVDHEYILQLDYKEVDAEDVDLDDVISLIPELWNCKNYKVISFDLGNDQYYFAKIPAENEICDLYEIKVSEVNF